MPKGIKGFQKGHKLCIGRKCSEETRKKISIANKKNPSRGVFKKGHKPLGAAIKGFNKGRIISKDWREKISNSSKGRIVSNKTRKKISQAHKGRVKPWLIESNKRRVGPRPERRGENSTYWKGGITPTMQAIRNSLDNRNWRTAVFERDDYTCQMCGERGGDLEADHYPKAFAQRSFKFLALSPCPLNLWTARRLF